MRVVAKFTARSSNGAEYEIRLLRGDRAHGVPAGPSTSPDAMGLLQTADGKEVRQVKPGVFEVVDGLRTIVVTSDDPGAQ